MGEHNDNTEFFVKAASQKITWSDIFSNVFIKHTKEEGERLFIAGTAASTPPESQMVAQWRKPWLFAYVGIFGLAFIGIMYGIWQMGAQQHALTPIIFIGGLIMPLAVLLLMWELNIPRNIPLYLVLAIFFTGGGLSIIFTLLMNNVIGEIPIYFAPLTEEPAKLLVICLFLNKPKYKFTLNGLLIGAAVGAGFGAFETMGKTLEFSSLELLLSRSLLAPGTHTAWAALYGGALAMAKRGTSLHMGHFANNLFLICFATSFGLHFTWNYEFIIVELPLVIDLKFILLIFIAWIVLLRLVKLGILEVMKIPRGVPGELLGNHSVLRGRSAESGTVSVKCVNGEMAGQVFPTVNGQLILGRDPASCNLLFSATTRGVSRLHCIICVNAQGIILTDKGSSQGTFLENGRRLAHNQSELLRPGDRFYLADKHVMFEVLY